MEIKENIDISIKIKLIHKNAKNNVSVKVWRKMSPHTLLVGSRLFQFLSQNSENRCGI